MSVTVSTMGEADFTSIARNMSRWVNHVLSGPVQRFRDHGAWAPSVNLYEDAEHYCIIVDLAGMDPNDIELRIEEGMLVLSGQRPIPEMPDCCGSMRVHLMEIDHGAFSRKVDLPKDVDTNAAASLDAIYGNNGYLRVRLPKR
jgi:HSP20 family protein